jgi:arylsulfatase A-like enzyme
MNHSEVKRSNRREFLGDTLRGGFAALGVAALSSCGSPEPSGNSTRRPNIVFIMADDLGYGDLGIYGQKQIRTPNINRLAGTGLKFTNAYAGCTVCAPSRSVLMTGYHMGHTSVRSNPGGVPLLPEDVTVAEVLKSAGYATGIFGKWGLGDIGTDGHPNKQGFDEFCGYLHQVHAHYYYPEFIYRNAEELPLAGNADGGRETYAPDVITEHALQFIRDHKDEPFFLYVPSVIPHLELLVPEDSMAEYRGKFPEDKPYRHARDHYAAQDEPRTAYAAMITRLDLDIGNIMATLAQLGLEDDTIVFFTSDNGAATPLWNDDFFGSTGGLRGHKQNFYEGGIRTPFIARWPNRIAPHTVSDHVTAFYDVLPTLAELAGAQAPEGLDGISIVPTLLGAEAAGREQATHEFLYWELPRYDGQTGTFLGEVPRQAVRMGEWKAVRPEPDGNLELYNLREDPAETANVAAEQPEVMAKIEAYLQTARNEPRPQDQPEHGWSDSRSGR